MSLIYFSFARLGIWMTRIAHAPLEWASVHLFGYQSRRELMGRLYSLEEDNEILQEKLANAKSDNMYLKRQLEGRQTAERFLEPRG